MSFFDDASLVFLPSGQAGKDGKAYSMKPTDGSGDFTFSRGSNLTATRVDSNGLIEKGRENLLLYSNGFNNWTNSNTSETSGQSGYDGSSDAWLLTKTAASGFIFRSFSGSGVQTFSAYVKANASTWGLLQCIGGSNPYAYFDLGTGVVGSIGGGTISNSIEDVGGGWYRISLIHNTTISSARIYPAEANTASGTSGSIYIQDAQAEIGLVATEYIESGATTGLAGLLEDSPRFDYSGGASCSSLLLEGSMTNVWEYSEYLDYSFASVSSITTTQNTTETLSPEGLYNATKLEGVGSWSLRDFIGGTDTGTWTISCYVKAVNASSNNTFRLSVGGNNFSSNLTATSEWQRFEFTFTNGGASAAGLLRDTSSNDADLYIYGMQVEQSSHSTSYIPNHSGGSVTRAADVNTLLNQSGVIGQTAGTILFDAYFDEADKVNFSISDSTSSNYILIDTTSGKQVFARVQQGGSTQATISTSGSFFTEGDRLKCAIAYDDRDMAFYINGTQIGTAAPNFIPACDDVRFSRWNGALAADQRVNRVLLFDTRISNGNLATLTS
jgi:hypothetical protein